MHLDGWTFAFQIVNFLVLVGLLWRFLYRPVLDGIRRRQEAVTRALDEAAQATAAMERLAAERTAAEAALEADLARRRQAIAAEAVAERERSRNEIQAAGDRLLAEARERLAAERRAAEAAVRDAGAVVAVHLARRLADGVDARAVTAAFLPQVEATLTALDDTVRTSLHVALAQGASVTVATAHPLAADAQAVWTARLAAILGVDPRPVFVTEPALIAGVELRLPGHRVACHWAGQLAHLQQEIHDGHLV